MIVGGLDHRFSHPRLPDAEKLGFSRSGAGVSSDSVRKSPLPLAREGGERSEPGEGAVRPVRRLGEGRPADGLANRRREPSGDTAFSSRGGSHVGQVS